MEPVPKAEVRDVKPQGSGTAASKAGSHGRKPANPPTVPSSSTASICSSDDSEASDERRCRGGRDPQRAWPRGVSRRRGARPRRPRSERQRRSHPDLVARGSLAAADLHPARTSCSQGHGHAPATGSGPWAKERESPSVVVFGPPPAARSRSPATLRAQRPRRAVAPVA